MIKDVETRSQITLTDDKNRTVKLHLQHNPYKEYPVGAVGLVKQAINPETGEKFAVKIFSRIQQFDKEEERNAIERNYKRDLVYAQSAVNANRLLERNAFYAEREIEEKEKDTTYQKLYLFTPWIDGRALDYDGQGRMDDEFLKLPFEKRYAMAVKLLEQVNQLHSKNHIHGDIKIQNVMWTLADDIYLVDLDTVRVPGTPGDYSYDPDYIDDANFKNYGNRRVTRKAITDSQDWRSDVYAAGITLVAMLPELGSFFTPNVYIGNRYHPKSRVQKSVHEQIQASKIPAHYHERAEALRKELGTMLNEKPNERHETHQILAALASATAKSTNIATQIAADSKENTTSQPSTLNTENLQQTLQELTRVYDEVYKSYSNYKFPIASFQSIVTQMRKECDLKEKVPDKTAFLADRVTEMRNLKILIDNILQLSPYFKKQKFAIHNIKLGMFAELETTAKKCLNDSTQCQSIAACYDVIWNQVNELCKKFSAKENKLYSVRLASALNAILENRALKDQAEHCKRDLAISLSPKA
jgi:serine/threonine protein kinase